MSEKNYADILRVEGVNARGFGIIGKIVMQDRRLTRDAKCIYAYFRSYAGGGTTAFPSVKKICYDLGFKKEETYRKHLKLLVKYGYIEIEQKRNQGKFSHNIYTMIENPQPLIDESIENTDYEPTPQKRDDGKKHRPPKKGCTEKKGDAKKGGPKKGGSNNNNINKNNNIYKNNNKEEVVVQIEKLKMAIKENLGEELTNENMITLLKETEKVGRDIEYIKEKCKIAKESNYTDLMGFLIKAIQGDWKKSKSNKKNTGYKENWGNGRTSKYDADELEKMIKRKHQR